MELSQNREKALRIVRFIKRWALRIGCLVSACWLMAMFVNYLGNGRYMRGEKSASQIIADIQLIEHENNITIGIGDPSTYFVPPDKPIHFQNSNLEVAAVKIEDLPPVIEGIKDALSVYPDGSFSAICKAIFITRYIKFDGINAGGTVGTSWIILPTSNKNSYGSVREHSERATHHEFSSIIWNQHIMTQVLWHQTLPDDWKGKDDIAAILASGKEAKPRPETGFLSAYAQSTIENDFNTYAEFVFSEPGKLIKLAKKHFVIRQKIGLLMDAYIATDPKYKAYFDDTGLSEFSEEVTIDLSIPLDQLPKPERIDPQ